MKIFLTFSIITVLNSQKIHIGFTEWIGNAITVIAKEKGFWKEQGLDVTLHVYRKIQHVYEGIDNGKIHIGHDMIGSVVSRLDRNEYKILLNTNWSSGGDKIITKDHLVFPLKKGTKIGVYSSRPSVTFYLDAFLKENDMLFSNYLITQVDPRELTNKFIKKELDVIVNFDPYALNAISKGDGKKVSTSKDFPGIIPEGWFTCRSGLNTLTHDVLNRLYIGWYKALIWSRKLENSKEYGRLVNKYLFVSKKPYNFRVLGMMRDGVSFYIEDQLVEQNTVALDQYLKNLKYFIEKKSDLDIRFSIDSFKNIHFSHAFQSIVLTNN